MRKPFAYLMVAAGLTACGLFVKHPKDWNAETPGNGFDSIAADSVIYDGDYADYTRPELEHGAPGEMAFPEYKGSKTMTWKLQHMHLAIEPIFESRTAEAKATITLKPNFKPQESLALDAKGMLIHSVSVASIPPPNVRLTALKIVNQDYSDSLQLKLTFNRPVSAIEGIELTIAYTARPYNYTADGSAAISEDRGMYFINYDLAQKNKPRQMWTQCEPESGSRWFPTIESTQQKLSQRIEITVHDTMTTLSNGKKLGSEKLPNNKRKDVWEQTLPHAPYLVMLAAGNWAEIKDRNALLTNGSFNISNVPVSYYVDKKYAPFAKTIFGNTPEMIEYFSSLTGIAFPWDKYSQVVVHEFVSGAMENTSAVVHMNELQHTSRQHLDESYEDYISHELFHHWFGDLVTAESWANLTLNESWATYGQYLWQEHKYGNASADEMLQEFRNTYLGYGFGGNEEKHLVRFNYQMEGEMFDAVSYHKGACILHMLRTYLGDEVFFEGVKRYLSKHAYQSAEAHQLRMAFEEVSGEDLNWFFNQWYYGDGHPIIQIEEGEYQFEDSTFSLVVTQSQTNRNTFVLPARIAFVVDGQTHVKDVFIDERQELIDVKLPGNPSLVIFDPDNDLLFEFADESENYSDFHLRKLVDELKATANPGRQYVTLQRIASEVASRASASAENDDESSHGWFDIDSATVADALEFVLSNNASEMLVVRALNMGYFHSYFPVKYRDLVRKYQSTLLDPKKTQANVRAQYIRWMYYNDPLQNEVFKQLTGDSSPTVASLAVSAFKPGDSLAKYVEAGLKNSDFLVAYTWMSKALARHESDAVKNLRAVWDHPWFDGKSYFSYLGRTLSKSPEIHHFKAVSALDSWVLKERPYLKADFVELVDRLYEDLMTLLNSGDVMPEGDVLARRDLYLEILNRDKNAED